MTLGRQQQRRDTAANWAANNPTLADGEVGVCSDVNFIKIGDGTTAWNSLSTFVGRIVTTSIKTANYTAGPWELIPVDATSGAVVITLPTAPVAGTQVYVKRNDATANSVTVVCGGSDRYNIPGGTQTQSLYFTNYGFCLQYSSSLALWFQVSVVMPVGQLDARYLKADGTAQTISGKTLDVPSNTVTGLPADFMLVQVGNIARATGSGDFAVAHRVGRAFTATSVVYQFDTADASGNTTVELRRNGAQVTSSSVAVSAANQVDGTGTDAARTVAISQSFSAGDRINLQITGIGTTPGKGLRAWIVGTWN